MHLVAIGELHGPIAAATGPLASDLGTTAYELRLVLNAGFPAVVLATVDESLARAAFAAITRQGHVAIACERRDVVPSARMTRLRDFELAKDGLVARTGASDRLPYDDILAVLVEVGDLGHLLSWSIASGKLQHVKTKSRCELRRRNDALVRHADHLRTDRARPTA